MDVQRKAWLAPAGVFATVVAVVVGFAATGGGNGAGAPPKLPIGGSAGRNYGEQAAMSADSRAGAPAGTWFGGGRYRIVGTLPDDLPKEAPAYTVPGGKADEAAVRRLAAALGVTAAPTREGDGWLVSDGTKALRVLDYAGNPWYFSPELACKYDGREGAGGGSTGSSGSSSDPNGSTSSDPDGTSSDSGGNSGSGVTPAKPSDAPASDRPTSEPVEPAPAPMPPDGCAYATDVAVVCPEGQRCEQPQEPPAPSDDEARAVATKVLAAAGYDLTKGTLRVEKGWGRRYVVFAPEVGGLPTFGWEARIGVNAEREVVEGNGAAAVPAREDVYPLLDPHQAVERANKQAGSGPRCDAMTPECTGEPPVRDVTAVRLGLIQQHSYRDPRVSWLVPAWLLTVKDSQFEEPVLALPDEYLEQPPTPEECGKDGATCPLPAEPMPAKDLPADQPADGGGANGSTGTVVEPVAPAPRK